MPTNYIDIIVGDVFQRCVPIPTGTFMMGSPDDDAEAYDNEKPQHMVHIDKSFYMANTSCTIELWNAVMPEHAKKVTNPRHPATYVSYYDALEFCHRLSQHTAKAVCLPTEEQWEYACRAGTKTRYNIGNTLTKVDANIEADAVCVVGNYTPNAWGLYDMHGNVLEWTCSKYDTTDVRVIRGGSWGSVARYVRAACRFWGVPASRSDILGFRFIVYT